MTKGESPAPGSEWWGDHIDASDARQLQKAGMAREDAELLSGLEGMAKQRSLNAMEQSYIAVLRQKLRRLVRQN